MRTILDILAKAGGWRPGLYLKIGHPLHMELVIEAAHEPGPMGLPALSVAHYGEQNGDLMRWMFCRRRLALVRSCVHTLLESAVGKSRLRQSERLRRGFGGQLNSHGI